MLDVKKIKQIPFSEDQYTKSEFKKTQIVLHHTVSNPMNSTADIDYWLSNKEKVATCVIVQGDGQIFQCFSSKFFGYHLGLTDIIFHQFGLTYQPLDKTSIGVEIDSYGGLTFSNGKWKTVYGNEIPKEQVQQYPSGYRGFFGFQKYTDAQIRAVEDLLIYWHGIYGIPLTYNENMFMLNSDALSGKSGVWSHTSFRSDKSDVHPQPELIQMLKGIKI